jgi:hypothetical protein
LTPVPTCLTLEVDQRAGSETKGTNMGKPITATGGASSAVQVAQSTTQSAAQQSSSSPVQSPVQSSPAPAAPVRLWPPAWGWRNSALDGSRSAHIPWQTQWNSVGPKLAGADAVDSVSSLKSLIGKYLHH